MPPSCRYTPSCSAVHLPGDRALRAAARVVDGRAAHRPLPSAASGRLRPGPLERAARALPLPVGAGFLGIQHFTPPWDVFFLPLFNLLIFFVSRPLQRLRAGDHRLHHRDPDRPGAAVRAADPLAEGDAADAAARHARCSASTRATGQGRRGDDGPLPGARRQPVRWLPAARAPDAHPVRALPGAEPRLQRGDLYPARTSLAAVHDVPGALPGHPRRCQLADPVLRAPIAGAVQRARRSTAGTSPHFLPLNCQLIDPLKLQQPIDTTVGWLFNLNLAAVDHVFSLSSPGSASPSRRWPSCRASSSSSRSR